MDHMFKSLLLKLLVKQSPVALTISVVLGVIAGGMYSVVIPLLVQALDQNPSPSHGAFAIMHGATGYFTVCILILVAKTTSVVLVSNISKSATGNLRIDLSRKINAMPIRDLEQIGFARLIGLLSDDVANVGGAAVAIPMILVSTVTILGMLAYLFSIHSGVGIFTLVMIVIGVAVFQMPVAFSRPLYEKARDLRDRINEGINGLVHGSYELKLNRTMSENFIAEELAAPQHAAMRLEKRGDATLHLAGASSDLLVFLVVGVIVFKTRSFFWLPTGDASGVVMALLYIANPVASILSMLRHLQTGDVAMSRIQSLLTNVEESISFGGRTNFADWSEYRAVNVTFSYRKEESSSEANYSLHPTTLSFKRGEVCFIVGGNGSGKSTLSKVLSLHYPCLAGAIYFDESRVEAGNLVDARSRIAVVFSSYYLFGKIYRTLSASDVVMVNNYLRMLGLEEVTQFVDGHFTATKLSDGQRRRLALVIALLEDRDIYILDEWAADQDPEFKCVFYDCILPELKKCGKLIIVITHDDRYFDRADRIVRMEDGKVINDHHPQEPCLHPLIPVKRERFAYAGR
jgi:putative ATP-binding cassette transporter